jgi:hypothetical protein
MTNGAWNLEIHNPNVGHGSLIAHHHGISGDQAAALMEKHLDKALLLRERGRSTEADHEALRLFQIRTGKRLTPHW